MNKEQQKKLLTEIMEADEKYGLYEVRVSFHSECVKLLKEYGNVIHKDGNVYYQFPNNWYREIDGTLNMFEECQGSPDTSPNTQNK
jgi:predicted N-acyltransferase